jgi:F-type H+-transporting ATPase subunit delta
MKGTRASLRYAKAALAFAEEAKSSHLVANDMQSLMEMIKANSELSSVLENPMLAAEKKEVVLNEIMPKASEQTKQVFSLLATNNRMELLGPTCEHYLKLYAFQNGEVKATVTTAIPLTTDLEKQVLHEAKKLSDKKAILENKIDPSIIGGFILKIGDMQYDASVSNQLKAIKTSLTKTNSI